jgi:hypothetical protein
MKINFNKKYVLFKVLLVIMMLNILPKTKSKGQTWCWTRSMANEPTYVFDLTKGGINWGYCEKVSNSIATTRYEIEVETSSIARSGTE